MATGQDFFCSENPTWGYASSSVVLKPNTARGGVDLYGYKDGRDAVVRSLLPFAQP